jgi:hypothetical protein
MFEKKWLFMVALALLGMTAGVRADDLNDSDETPTVEPALSATPGVSPTAVPTLAGKHPKVKNKTGLKKAEADDDDDSDEDKPEPFTPNWTGNVGFTYTNQPSQAGPGEITEQLLLTGDYYLTQSGHYFSVAVGGGQQQLEGIPTSMGTFTVGGGLGFGFFQPSLETEFQQGAQALISVTSTLTLDFQLWKPFGVEMTFAGGTESHQGAVSQLLGTSDNLDEIDSYNLTGGVELSFIPWDFLTLTATGNKEYSTTYQYQNVTHTVQTQLNQTEQIPSVTFGSGITCFTDFTLTLDFQIGEEELPKGVIYSPVQGKTVKFGTATTEGFTGYTCELAYNL